MKKHSISAIKEKIIVSLAETCQPIGFKKVHDQIFANKKHDVIRLLRIDFLNTRHASTFNSCTASFSLELGIFYNFTSYVGLCPEFDKIHIRGALLRDFYQKSPQNLKGFGLFHPERWRRDIWWVNKNGNNINQVTKSASRVVRRKAIKWLDKYSDLDNALYFLKNCPEKATTGPFFLGKIDSPYRSKLINEIEKIKT